ncbi:MAG: ABC transporter permease [Betaproteobacteria bacterium]|nr:ABC transporter permease [Betaproteobacteria bacterium]
MRYAPLLLVAAGWELAVLSGAISPNLLPRFSAVIETLWELLRSFELPREVGVSLFRQSIGFALAVVIGVAVGVAMARVRAVELALRPLVTLCYPVPIIALFPVLVLMVGLDHRLQVIVILLGSVVPTIVSSFNAARGVDQYLIWSARNLGTSGRRTLWKVVIPAALPEILSGIRTTLALSFVLLVAAEQLGANRGIGAFALRAGENGFYTGMFAAILTIGLLGFAVDRLYLALMLRLLRWQEKE